MRYRSRGQIVGLPSIQQSMRPRALTHTSDQPQRIHRHRCQSRGARRYDIGRVAMAPVATVAFDPSVAEARLSQRRHKPPRLKRHECEILRLTSVELVEGREASTLKTRLLPHQTVAVRVSLEGVDSSVPFVYYTNIIMRSGLCQGRICRG